MPDNMRAPGARFERSEDMAHSNKHMKQEFAGALLRFRKVDICALVQGDIQFVELAVMKNIPAACPQGEGCLNVQHICQQLNISKPAVSQILNSLEKKGYIVRRISPGDRRRITVQTTPEGLQVLEHSAHCYDAALDTLCERFGPGDIETLVTLLDRLNQVYSQIKTENRSDNK